MSTFQLGHLHPHRDSSWLRLLFGWEFVNIVPDKWRFNHCHDSLIQIGNLDPFCLPTSDTDSAGQLHTDALLRLGRERRLTHVRQLYRLLLGLPVCLNHKVDFAGSVRPSDLPSQSLPD